MPLRRRFKELLQSRQPSPQPTGSRSAPEPSSVGQLPQTVHGSEQTTPNSTASPVLVRGGHNYGIRVLYDPGNEACVDIVFIHGLTGNAYDTWLHKETKIHWPSELLGQDISDSRILSFGYDANVVGIWGWGPDVNSRLSNHAENLVGKLVRERERSDTENRKILFVAHSFGGLVVEQALIHSKNSAEKYVNQIERFTAGIIFLGVPHCGSDLEAWATIGRRMVSVLTQTNKEIVKVLNPNSEMLHIVENNFHHIVRQRKDDPIKMTSFYEELPVRGIACQFWMVPRTSNRLFTGRQELAQRLTQAFSRDRSTQLQEQKVFVISGIGDVDYKPYIPFSKNGDILMTTRNPECKMYETVGHEFLVDLEPGLARELLLRAISVPKSQWKEEEEATTALINILGSHTLAIIQAGAFVRQRLCTLEEYPSAFQQQRDELLKFHTKQNESPYRNVYATFEVAAEHLQRSEAPEYSDALTILHTFAYMSNNGISEEIFQRASKYALELKDSELSSDDEQVWCLSNRHVTRLPECVQQGWSRPPYRLRWRKALQILHSLSIITITEGNGPITISLHPLVHAWAKERQDSQTRSRAWQSAAATLALSCEGYYAFCPFFRTLQPHVRACVSQEIEKYVQDISIMETAQILFQFAYLLYRISDSSSLNSLMKQICLIMPYNSGASYEIEEQIKLFSGRVAFEQGDYGQAASIFRDIHESRAQELAEDHPKRLNSQHSLAIAYRVNGQIDKAIELLEHVVKIRKRLAKDHPDRLASESWLAHMYEERREFQTT
ncbi:MAG: hypothetical protein Q9167_004851 [Letrouitia subvulpina]